MIHTPMIHTRAPLMCSSLSRSGRILGPPSVGSDPWPPLGRVRSLAPRSGQILGTSVGSDPWHLGRVRSLAPPRSGQILGPGAEATPNCEAGRWRPRPLDGPMPHLRGAGALLPPWAMGSDMGGDMGSGMGRATWAAAGRKLSLTGGPCRRRPRLLDLRRQELHGRSWVSLLP